MASPTRVRASRSWGCRVGTPRKARATVTTIPTARTAFTSSGRALTTRRLPPGGRSRKGSGGAPELRVLQRLELLGDGSDRGLGVAEEHAGLGVDEQRVVDAGVARAHGALEHDHGCRLVDVEDRHAVDRAVGLAA